MAGFSDRPAALALRAQLAACPAAAACAVHLYPGESHAFMNPVNDATRAKRAMMGFKEPDPANQDLAWSRLFAFLAQHLQGQ